MTLYEDIVKHQKLRRYLIKGIESNQFKMKDDFYMFDVSEYTDEVKNAILRYITNNSESATWETVEDMIDRNFAYYFSSNKEVSTPESWMLYEGINDVLSDDIWIYILFKPIEKNMQSAYNKILDNHRNNQKDWKWTYEVQQGKVFNWILFQALQAKNTDSLIVNTRKINDDFYFDYVLTFMCMEQDWDIWIIELWDMLIRCSLWKELTKQYYIKSDIAYEIVRHEDTRVLIIRDYIRWYDYYIHSFKFMKSADNIFDYIYDRHNRIVYSKELSESWVDIKNLRYLARDCWMKWILQKIFLPTISKHWVYLRRYVAHNDLKKDNLREISSSDIEWIEKVEIVDLVNP